MAIMGTLGTASGFTADTAPAYDDLLGGVFPRVPSSGILLSGQNLQRGSLLGKVGTGNASVEAAEGNTGDGVLTLDVTTPVLAGASPGVYTVKCTTAATNGGTFTVKDPAGATVGTVAVGATFATQIKFVIADGEADFAEDDEFDVTVAQGSGKYKLSLAAANDGSAIPVAILAADVDASGGDVANAPMYMTGEFNSRKVIFGTGHTATSVKVALRDRGIFLQNTDPAAKTG